MAKVCDITGRGTKSGYKVSHANNRTKRKFYINLQFKTFYIPETDSWVTLRISTAALRTINKKGIFKVMQEAQQKGTLNRVLAR